MNRVELFIAKRLLLTRRRVRFINVIGVISICGIAVGVAALLIALSVFNGFSGVVTSVLVGFDPHVRIEKRGSMNTDEVRKLENVLQQFPAVKAYAPFVSGKAMLAARTFNRVVYVRGLEEQRLADVSGVKDRLVLGSISLNHRPESGGIVIGFALADRLSAIVGTEIIMISPYGFQSALSGFSAPQSTKFVVSGIYESNNKDYDASYAYISLSAAQQLFNLEGKVNGMEIRLHDISSADEVKEQLQHLLAAEYSISTWYDLHRTLYLVMRVERWTSYVLLLLIIVVATFNMLGSLTMGVMEKRRDIAVLKSMGMASRRLVRLFMIEGVLIGIVGTCLGVALGLIVLFLQMKFQLFSLDTNVYIIPAVPVEIHWMDFITISLASLGLSCLAAYYPARRAASTHPADELRWE